jgi:hypothetical protein
MVVLTVALPFAEPSLNTAKGKAEETVVSIAPEVVIDL